MPLLSLDLKMPCSFHLLSYWPKSSVWISLRGVTGEVSGWHLRGLSQQPTPVGRRVTEAILSCADLAEPLEAGAIAACVTSEKSSRAAELSLAQVTGLQNQEQTEWLLFQVTKFWIDFFLTQERHDCYCRLGVRSWSLLLFAMSITSGKLLNFKSSCFFLYKKIIKRGYFTNLLP